MTSEDLLVRTVLGSWKQSVAQVDKTLASLGDEDLQREVAPGRNRIYYLLGHLTAVNDRLLPLLRLGDRLHPELDESFITHPDRTFEKDPFAPSALRGAWSEVNEKLLAAFEQLRPEEWLERHDAVSAEDFAKDRNRAAAARGPYCSEGASPNRCPFRRRTGSLRSDGQRSASRGARCPSLEALRGSTERTLVQQQRIARQKRAPQFPRLGEGGS